MGLRTVACLAGNGLDSISLLVTLIALGSVQAAPAQQLRPQTAADRFSSHELAAGAGDRALPDAGPGAAQPVTSGWLGGKIAPPTPVLGQVEFGAAIDSDGERAIVGAPGADEDHRNGGAAYVLRLTGSGQWELEAVLTPPVTDHAESRAFGTAVALDGDLALVGAPWRPGEHPRDSGYAHLFAWDGVESRWHEVCRVEGPQPNGRVGSAVDLDGTYAVIGDPLRVVSSAGSSPIHGAGSVLVVEYLGGGADPCRAALVEPPEPEEGLEFGTAVAIDGDAIAVGAPGASVYSPSFGGRTYEDCGEVTVVRHSGNVWQHEKTVTGVLLGTERRMGSSIALAGDSLVTSVPGRGSAYLFRRNEDGPDAWGLVRDFTFDLMTRFRTFGLSIAATDDLVVVGVPGSNPTTSEDRLEAGAAIVLRRANDTYRVWAIAAILEAPEPHGGDRFGASVAAASDRVVIGAPFRDQPADDAGAVFLYSASGANNTQWLLDDSIPSIASGSARGGQLGSSVGLAAAHMAIGQPGANTVHVFDRIDDSAFGWSHAASLKLEAGSDRFHFRVGEALAVADGAIVVGAPYDGAQVFASGAAYVLVDRGQGWQVAQLLEPPVAEPLLRFGVDVAIGGSVLAIAAQGPSGGSGSDGSVFVYEPLQGSSASWFPVAELHAPSDPGALPSPTALDTDGETIVVCDPTWRPVEDPSGACDVFDRADGEWRFVQRLTASGSEPWMSFGSDVAVSADTILVGAPYWNDPLLGKRARAIVFERTDPGLWGEVGEIGDEDGIVTDHVGFSVALEGNLAVVGAPSGGAPRTSGSALVYRRSGARRGEWHLVAELHDETPETGEAFGWSVATNGAEVLVGAPLDCEHGFEGGTASLFVRRLARTSGARARP